MDIQASTLLEDVFHARSTHSDVEYCVLIPENFSRDERLPLILHLHGAMSSAAKSLGSAKPTYDASWASGRLPRAIVACPTTPTINGFYIDQIGGQSWERLIADEFPGVMIERFGTSGTRAVVGASMGGYGALKIAFRKPDSYVAVAAMCPAVFPAEHASDVKAHNLPSILSDLHRAMGHDSDTYTRNSVYGILRKNLDGLHAVNMPIFLDCGDADEFGLYDGAQFLHRLLTQLEIEHDFRPVPGAGHADASAPSRLMDALSFIGRQLGAYSKQSNNSFKPTPLRGAA